MATSIPITSSLTKLVTPTLIDFAWAHDGGHLLKDFVLMECSLRFLLFPSHLNWREHHQVSEVMTIEDGPQQVLNILDHTVFCHQGKYRRMALAVDVVRECARRAMGEQWSFDDYMAVQFIVLYGLSKLATYPFDHCVDSLGLMGTHLRGTTLAT